MRNGIKKIVVSPRPVTLAIGDVVYDGIKGCMRKIVIKSLPYNKYPEHPRGMWVCDVESTYLPSGSALDKALNRGVMCHGQIYLGDDGVEGYKYDDRPSGIGRTEEGAHLRSKFYGKWLALHKAKFNDFTFSHYHFA